jgi:hypothetical protein
MRSAGIRRGLSTWVEKIWAQSSRYYVQTTRIIFPRRDASWSFEPDTGGLGNI